MADSLLEIQTAMLKNIRARTMPKLEKPPVFDVLPDVSPDQQSIDGTSSTASFDRFCADILGDCSLSPRDNFWDGDDSSTSTSMDSSPLGWPTNTKERSRLGKLHSLPKYIEGRHTAELRESPKVATVWDQKEEKKHEEPEISETELMKERFAKLLLGEDLSGGGKGVSSALAISNAITNLSASVFGQLWRLEPLHPEKKKRWQREMSWLLSVSDYIVEFVPSMQELSDGITTEVMVTRPRSDLHMHLPALRKLDAMLLGCLDSFKQTEFWYADKNSQDSNMPFRQEEKWWLPIPKVQNGGLSVEARKHLQNQRDSVNQILKLAMEINAQVLMEIEIPMSYWDALPKNARTSLGENLYRAIASDNFNPNAIIASIESAHEHNVVELLNRVEAAIHISKRKLQNRQLQAPKSSWGGGSSGGEHEKRELLASKAESLMILLRHKFPGLPQTALDIQKIQWNKDIGHSILESYSRVLESLAFNVFARINEVISVDDMAKSNQHSEFMRSRSTSKGLGSKSHSQLPTSGNSGYQHPSGLPKSASTHAIVNSTSHMQSVDNNKSLSEFIGWSVKESQEIEHYSKSPPSWHGANKHWSYSESINTLRSPPSRD